MSNERRKPYPFDRIEPRWQHVWAERRTFHALNPGEPGFDPAKPKYYVLDMFPYPSGAGLHVGHPEGYTATDIIARYKRMRGFNVLHPMGWDAFGLPAEQYAIKTGQHPAVTTADNVARFKQQLQSIGFAYDWEREVNTTDPGYYKWTQWIFLQLYNSYFDKDLNKAMPIAYLQEKMMAKLDWARREHPELFAGNELDKLMSKLRLPAVSERPGGLSQEPQETKPEEQEQIYKRFDASGNPIESEVFGGSLAASVGTEDPASVKSTIEAFTRNAVEDARLAYISEAPVNWCPALGTVLANEEVIDGKSEVGGHPVERRPMRQWMLRITEYAQRLIDELEGLDWPESIKLLQRNWIGRSEGAIVKFALGPLRPDLPVSPGEPYRFPVFTTRPDTLYGATYMVLAPEHHLVEDITTDEHKAAVTAYRAAATGKSDLERTELSKEKTGVFTGAFAINPVNGEKIPIWIADYVMMGYGTGAIMAVPAHDERDWEFAKKFALPIREVVSPEPRLGLGGGGVCDAEPLECFAGEGYAIRSGPLDGLPTAAAKAEIIRLLAEKGLGERRVNYKLRDWLFSRQRYWGEPFPIVWENLSARWEAERKESSKRINEMLKELSREKNVPTFFGEGGAPQDSEALDVLPDFKVPHAIPESELPLTLPEMEDFKPTGTPEPPLSKAKDWLRYGDYTTRETNTMPQWAGSCWYYLRYMDAQNPDRFVGTEAERYWSGGGKPGGVDLYVGGTEHAVLHLLYARFWHKVLFDLGHVSTPEPFQRLVNQGLILGEDGAKMSKSRGNVVNPDDVVREYGADSLRLYEMFMGPLEASKPWSMSGVEGVFRFLARVWRLVMEENQSGEWVRNASVQDVPADKALLKVVHATIKKVGEDIEALSFNTAIAQMMVCTNALTHANPRPVSAIRLLLQVLNPFAPHLTEELWEKLNDESETKNAERPAPGENAYSSFVVRHSLLAEQAWPDYDPALLIEDEVELPVQVNGKLRDKIVVKKDAPPAEVEAAAMAAPKVAEAISGKTVRKIVVVPGRLVNIVV